MIRLVICTAVLTLGCVAARSTPPGEPVPRAAAHALYPDSLRETTDSLNFELLAAHGDSVVQRVAMRREMRVARVDGGTGFMITYASGAPFNSFDTLAVRHDLRPVWEILRTGGRRIDIRYDGRTVRARTLGNDGTTRTTTHTFARAPFAFNELQALIRALPLHVGYRVVVPLYSEVDDSVEMDTLAVAALRGDRWNVDFPDPLINVVFADPVIVERYEVERRTREIHFVEVTARKSGRHWRYVYPRSASSGGA